MDFEYYYAKLPNFIKYNKSFLNFFLSVSKKIRNSNQSSKQLNSQGQLLNLILLNCDINTKGTLKNIQLLYIELLRFFDNICSKYEIDYWLEYGTLLGAVRHEGFILWDDDIDVAMVREDYEKLIEILPKEISKFDYLKNECGLTLSIENHENYFKDFKDFHNIINNPDFPLKDRFSFLEFSIFKPYVKIDVFPKDYILDEKLNYYSKNYLSTKYRFNKEIKSGKKNFYEELVNKNNDLGLVKYKTNYIVSSLDDLELEPPYIYKTDNIFPLKKIKFEGFYFKCPNNVDEHLKGIYGDNYMEIPHIIEHHSLLGFIESQFSSKEELNKKFNELISYLQKINENY